MYGCNLHGQQFLGYEKVAQVGFGIYPVNEAVARLVDGGEVVGPFLVAHVHDAVGGEEHAVAPVARRHHAVHHVHSAVYGLKDVGRGAYAHQIARTVGGEYFVDHLYHVIHHLGRFSYGQAADGVAVSSEVGDESG